MAPRQRKSLEVADASLGVLNPLDEGFMTLAECLAIACADDFPELAILSRARQLYDHGRHVDAWKQVLPVLERVVGQPILAR